MSHLWEPLDNGFVLKNSAGDILTVIVPRAEPTAGWWFRDWSWPTLEECQAAVEDYFARRGLLI